MIPADRQDILHELHRLSELAPDVRFGQLIVNLSYLAVGPSSSAPWDVEDDQLLGAVRKLTRTLEERGAAVTTGGPAAVG